MRDQPLRVYPDMDAILGKIFSEWQQDTWEVEKLQPDPG